MIYILFKNDDDDYSTLPKDEPKKFIFTYIKGAPDLAHIQKKLRDVLDAADVENDSIVFCGPSYLSAVAGYIWMTNQKRTKLNMYAYSVKDKCYVKHVEDIEAE